MSIEPEKLEKAAFILKTIAHPVRLAIIELLKKNECMCVNDICQGLQTEQSLTSHHLANMKLKGILGSKRDGKHIYYHLREKNILSILDCVDKCVCPSASDAVAS